MTSPDSGAPPLKPPLARLGLFLLVLATLFVAQKLIPILPREPRLVVRNQSGGTVDLAIESHCGRHKIGRLGDGKHASVRFQPRPGCRYTINNQPINGDELIRLWQIARSQHEDVVLTLQYEGFAPLTTR